MKNKNFIIILTTSTFFYLFLFIDTYFDFNNEFKEKFRNLQNLEIHQKYSKTVHHIREEAHLERFFKEKFYKDQAHQAFHDCFNFGKTK